jgi:hypothetical protein
MMVRRWTRRLSPAVLIAVALAAGGCELGLHQVERATAGDCGAWRTGCPIVIDVARGDPIQEARVDTDRAAILTAAEQAPHRQCDVFAPGCQARVIGDVLVDRYLVVF